MIAPVVHLNGTSKQVLLDGYRNAGYAVRKAIDAVCAAYPNGRDHYVAGPGALKAATLEHNARVDKLKDVLKELEALAEAVCDQ